MVLLPKQRKSRSPPGFEASAKQENPFAISLPLRSRRLRQAERPPDLMGGKPSGRMPTPALEATKGFGAGWSSPVARQAHNLKVAGSNPAPATNKQPAFERVFLCLL